MALAPLTPTLCQVARPLFERRKFSAVSRLRLTRFLPLGRLPTPITSPFTLVLMPFKPIPNSEGVRLV